MVVLNLSSYYGAGLLKSVCLTGRAGLTRPAKRYSDNHQRTRVSAILPDQAFWTRLSTLFYGPFGRDTDCDNRTRRLAN